jgi:predicted nucleotidyltransferase
MRRDRVIAKLKTAEPALRSLGVDALYLFGSHARDEAGADSDIDVFIDLAPEQPSGFLRFMDALDVLRDAVGEKIDYGTRNGLHPLLRPQIEHEAIRVF